MDALGTVAVLLGSIAADDWPQWLGPTRDAVSTEKVAPWTDPLRVLWRVPAGEGHSSPVTAAGRGYLHVKTKDKDEEQVVAWDVATGRELWRRAYDRVPFKSPFGVGPRATPVVADGKLYTMGVTGILACWKADDGAPVWRVDTLREFKAKNLVFGVSCSPLVEGDLVIVQVGGPGAGVVAFRKDTGEVAWKALDDRATYASGVAIGQGPARQVVFLTHEGLVGLSPVDGKVFWKFPLVDKLAESSTTPVLSGDLLVGSSVTYGSACLRLSTKDGLPTAVEAWTSPSLTSYISTPVPAGEHLYMVTGTLLPPPSATLRCVDTKTGKILWNRPSFGQYHASILRTADAKLLMLDDQGTLVLVDPDPAQYRELAKSKVCGPTWAHPALSNGRLHVRDRQELLCLSLVP